MDSHIIISYVKKIHYNKRFIDILYLIPYYFIMIKEIIEKNFKTFVTEIDGNYQVTFQGIGGQEGYVIFREAKRGWSTKPISQNTYLIGDAEMYQVIDTLKMYMSLDEKDLTKVRQVFSSMSMEILENYLSTPTN